MIKQEQEITITDWVKTRRLMDAYLYKEKNAHSIPRSYEIQIDKDKPDPVPIESEDFWETLSGEQFQYDNKEVNQTILSWVNDKSAATYAINYKSSLDGRNMWLSLARAYEGEDARQLSISAARNKISIMYFTFVL